jgi:hypothetical protein
MTQLQIHKTYRGFLFANHDRRLEMNVYEHNELLVARLEEQVLDIAKQDIYNDESIKLQKLT